MSQTTSLQTINPGLGRMKGKAVVITGASNGIGRATSLLFAAEGADLVRVCLVARACFNC